MAALTIFLHQLAATGVARNAIAIAHHMNAAGWRVALVTVKPGGDLAEQAHGLDHVVLGGPHLPRKLELLRAVPALRHEIERLAPDVLLSAGNHAHLAALTAMQSLPAGTRPATVYRISNDLAHNAATGDPLSALSIRRLIAHRVVRDATRLVLVSPHLAADPLLTKALVSGKAQIIANGVDVDHVRARADEPCLHPWGGEAIPIVLGVGRLARQKNFASLVEAFAQARAQRPLRLIHVGGGAPAECERLQELATKLGVAADVAFVPRTSNPFPYFRAASVLALPSVWEGSANVLLEALACDLPLVASRLAGNAAEVLGHGRYGVLVDPYDPAEMARAILTQTDPASVVRPAGRAAAYDRSRALGDYQALFEELACFATERTASR
ncbi:glycosyltransferase [Novosphingobium sp. 9U]|uniref:glycosyltransferase n=1 Tax=Novosphingobium sp. 9U TaxID=2653158 RepID=UPI0012EF67D9|nr:glycosyltransferase [Novosphingobium sp. 9U]VWX53795.1 Putative glycosyltransferase [Novosphingobium sp. 9U]